MRGGDYVAHGFWIEVVCYLSDTLPLTIAAWLSIYAALEYTLY